MGVLSTPCDNRVMDKREDEMNNIVVEILAEYISFYLLTFYGAGAKQAGMYKVCFELINSQKSIGDGKSGAVASWYDLLHSEIIHQRFRCAAKIVNLGDVSDWFINNHSHLVIKVLEVLVDEGVGNVEIESSPEYLRIMAEL